MFELTLLHINDIHVRMDETNKYSATCKVRYFLILVFVDSKDFLESLWIVEHEQEHEHKHEHEHD